MIRKSTVCSILGSSGVIVTSVLAVKCSKKVEESDDIQTKTKKYLPAIVAGGASIGCILLADRFNKAEIAALTTAVGYFSKKFTDYEKEVREIVGDEKADEIEKKFYNKQLEQRLDEKLLEDKNTFKFIDKFSGASIIAPYANVVKALDECDKIYRRDGVLCWCDIFFLINESYELYDSYLGENLGWSKYMFEQWEYETTDVRFSLKKLDEDRYLIDYSIIPELGFYEY